MSLVSIVARAYLACMFEPEDIRSDKVTEVDYSGQDEEPEDDKFDNLRILHARSEVESNGADQH